MLIDCDFLLNRVEIVENYTIITVRLIAADKSVDIIDLINNKYRSIVNYSN